MEREVIDDLLSFWPVVLQAGFSFPLNKSQTLHQIQNYARVPPLVQAAILQ